MRVGPTFVMTPPTTVQYNESSYEDVDSYSWSRGEDL